MSEARASRNLSLLELGVAGAVILILFLYGMNRMNDLEVFSEKTGVETMIRNMRSNLNLWMSEQIIQGQRDIFYEMDGKNPVGVIFDIPGNYLGEMEILDARSISKGSWVFEKSTGEMVYQVMNVAAFSSKSGEKQIRLRLSVRFRDRDNNQRFDYGIDQIEGLGLENTNEYRWLTN